MNTIHVLQYSGVATGVLSALTVDGGRDVAHAARRAAAATMATARRAGDAVSALLARTRVGRVFNAVMAVATRYIPWLAVVFAACLVIPGPFDEIGALIVVAVYAAFKPDMRADLAVAIRTK